MIKSWIFRSLVGAAFALPLMLVSVALAQADQSEVVPTPAPAAGELDCQSCHDDFHAAWASGRHGPAATAGFQSAWKQQGRPQACLSCHTLQGLQCETCHLALPDHPDSPASVDKSPARCGECHSATYLGWQVSQHGSQDMTCVDCHDAHATGQEMKGDVSMLCANCHKDDDSNFAHQAHLSVGLTCAECHLTPPGEAADAHAMRDHSFDVKVTTCNACHTSRTLTGEVVLDQPSPTPTPVDAMNSALDVQASSTPQPVSPVGFALLSIVVGFGAGIVVAPWVERRLRRPGGR
jgi:predicted CXXCH cytochrome family protein